MKRKVLEYGYRYSHILLALVLFLLPFLWIPHGKINIGGDSSRLYFLFPEEWVYNNLFAVNSFSTLYPYDPAFYLIPFVGTIALLKRLFLEDPYLLNNFVTGLLLASSFLVSRSLFKELLKKFVVVDPIIISLGALAYILSPLTLYEWYLALYYIFQLVAYPLIILLFIRFMEKPHINYLTVSAFVFFLFSMDFGFGNVAWIFAFFPITGLFLFYYALQHKQVKAFLITTLLFGLVFAFSNAFHLIPQSINAFEESSLANKFLFDKKFYFERGIGFYRSIIDRTRLSYNLFNQPPYLLATANANPFSELMYIWQVRQILLSFIFFGIPILVLVNASKLLHKKLNLLLVLILINFILLFLITGNFGLWSHKVFEFLYTIPGFTMFRGYYHKFAFVSSFYRSLLFIYSLMLFKELINKTKIFNLLVLFSFFVVILNAMPLLTGAEFYQKFFHSEDVLYTTTIPDSYLNLLTRIQKEPLVSRFSTFPLSYESYQALKGAGNSAYIGPSFIAMTTNKGDTSGLSSFQMFTDEVVKILETGDSKAFSELLSVLNIGFIFYDEEQFTYSRLSNIPYTEQLTKFFPTQNSVQNFLNKLNWKEIYKEGTYKIYYNSSAFVPRLELVEQQEKLNPDVVPSIEFTRIDSTMYIARVHNFSSGDILSLKEIFNPNWHLYLLPKATQTDYSNLNWDTLKVYNYGILSPELEEIKTNYENKLVTNLGDLQMRTDTVKVWENGKNNLVSLIPYNVSYISPNFSNTIQNDNLKQNLTPLSVLKTIRSRPKLLSSSHFGLQPSEYGFTEWEINSDKVCADHQEYCTKNIVNTYDYTLVFFYAPQMVFYISSVISIAFLGVMVMASFGSLIIYYRKNL